MCCDITICTLIVESDKNVGIEELVDDFVAFYAVGKTLMKHMVWSELYHP